jgi:hypothetical protein
MSRPSIGRPNQWTTRRTDHPRKIQAEKKRRNSEKGKRRTEDGGTGVKNNTWEEDTQRKWRGPTT